MILDDLGERLRQIHFVVMVENKRTNFFILFIYYEIITYRLFHDARRLEVFL